MTNLGTPVVSSRQWTYALAPNVRGGWNFITCSYSLHDTNPVEWIVVKDFTGPTPTVAEFDGLTGIYANSNYNIANQLRAANGRIFFALFQNYLAYYDPTTESVVELGPIVETPPVVPHTSTILFSAAFGSDGMLYLGTQESGNRPAMIVRVDPTTLAITVLGYVGSGATAGTTYAYYIAPDPPWIYVAYGESPWQVWALNIDTGASTLIGVGAAKFTAKSSGWQAAIGGVTYWCAAGVLSQVISPRNVLPLAGPLVNPPQIDATPGIGSVGWRPHGSTTPYTYVGYASRYATPCPIESLCPTTDGVLGNAAQYQGFFREPGAWFGAYQVISEGPRLQVGSTVYACGYPNGVLVVYDETRPWLTGTNPSPLGNYAASGMKYAACLTMDGGKLWCAGSRERDGVGAAIGCYDTASKIYTGTFAALDTVLPAGLAVVGDQAVMATKSIDGTTEAQLIVFDATCTEQRRVAVLDGVVNLGAVYAIASGLVGIVPGVFGGLGLYQLDASLALVEYVELPIAYVPGVSAFVPDGRLYIMAGTLLVLVQLNGMGASVVQDLGVVPDHMAIGGDGLLYYSTGPTLWSVTV